ncbi:MAG: hypothetical protein HY619_07985 [Thaumarchaeota archaeon]|nr:hypothetical protein [Nitrososphaerota archaeon]
MTVATQVVSIARNILRGNHLCKLCLTRQLPNASITSWSEQCDICGGMFSKLDDLTAKITQSLQGYEFDTFLIGATVPASVVEKEDSIRARFKLRGGESLKTALTSQLGRMLQQTLGKRVNYRNPDIAIIISPYTEGVEVIPKSIYVSGRYVKKLRGLPQKRTRCKTCNGQGCEECQHSGYLAVGSVEEALSKRLLKYFGGSNTRFTWIGSEDSNSLVKGNGRPFYAEILSPKVRHLNRSPSSWRRGDTAMMQVELMNDKPEASQVFDMKIEANTIFDKDVSKEIIQTVEEAFRNCVVEMDAMNKPKVLRKHVQNMKFKQVRGKRAILVFESEGGLNVRRLITGEGYTTPNVSSVSKSQVSLDEEKPFDVLGVSLRNR